MAALLPHPLCRFCLPDLSSPPHIFFLTFINKPKQSKVPVYSPLAQRGCGREAGCALGVGGTQCFTAGKCSAAVRILRRLLKLLAARECPSRRPHLTAAVEAPRSHTSGGSCDYGLRPPCVPHQLFAIRGCWRWGHSVVGLSLFEFAPL